MNNHFHIHAQQRTPHPLLLYHHANPVLLGTVPCAYFIFKPRSCMYQHMPICHIDAKITHFSILSAIVPCPSSMIAVIFSKANRPYSLGFDSSWRIARIIMSPKNLEGRGIPKNLYRPAGFSGPTSAQEVRGRLLLCKRAWIETMEPDDHNLTYDSWFWEMLSSS